MPGVVLVKWAPEVTEHALQIPVVAIFPGGLSPRSRCSGARGVFSSLRTAPQAKMVETESSVVARELSAVALVEEGGGPKVMVFIEEWSSRMERRR